MPLYYPIVLLYNIGMACNARICRWIYLKPRDLWFRYKVAVWATDPACATSNEIQQATHGLVSALRQRGALVDCEARPAGVDMAENFSVYRTLMASSTAGALLPPLLLLLFLS